MRLLIIITLFLGIGDLGCASAVDEPYFSCENDNQCPKGKSCVDVDGVDKVCKTPKCLKDLDCGLGQYCDEERKRCRDYCDGETDCDLTEYCDEETGRCA